MGWGGGGGGTKLLPPKFKNLDFFGPTLGSIAGVFQENFKLNSRLSDHSRGAPTEQKGEEGVVHQENTKRRRVVHQKNTKRGRRVGVLHKEDTERESRVMHHKKKRRVVVHQENKKRRRVCCTKRTQKG